MSEFPTGPDKFTAKVALPQVYEPIRAHLPRFIQHIRSGERGESPQKHIEGLLRHVTDPGLLKERTFLFNGDEENPKELEKAPPVAILNRNGFVQHVSELRRQYSEEGVDFNNTTFAIMDIADFRMADRAIDKTDAKNHAADLLLNRIGGKMIERVTVINDRLRTQHALEEVVVCRYGGDEFGLAFIGIDGNRARDLYDEITKEPEGVNSVDGYYEQGETVLKKKVRTTAEVVRIPEDPAKQDIFWQEFERGLLLDEVELGRSIRNGVHIGGEKAVDKQAQLLAMTDVELQERLTELGNRNTELRYLTELPVTDTAYNQQLAREVISYIEDVIYDPLLGEKVNNFHEFSERVIEDNIGEVMLFDFKGLKEINDVMGTTAGDKAIKAMFDRIAGIVSEGSDETSQIVYFRKGGSMVLGLKRGDNDGAALSADKQRQLRELKTFAIDGAEFDMGTTQYAISDNPEEATLTKSFGEFIQQAEGDWYLTMAKWMVKEGMVGILPEAPIAIHDDLTYPQIAQKQKLIQLFFGNSKRYVERRESLRDALTSLRDLSPEDKTKAKELLFAIMEQI